MAFRNNFRDSNILGDSGTCAHAQRGTMRMTYYELRPVHLQSIFHEEQGTASVRELCGLSAHVGRERELSLVFPHLRSIAICPCTCTIASKF